ncbi:MFP1 attachment factor [Dirofilaria immitis]
MGDLTYRYVCIGMKWILIVYLMSYNREKFLWTDALRLMLIREVKRRPTIWSSDPNNFNNMNDKMAFEITKKLHEVSTGICELTINHIKDEWKAISNECVRVLSRNDELTRTESSIWRFGFALKFMVYAITHTEEGNAHVLLYVNKLNIFYVVRENDVIGVLWPFSLVKVQLKGKIEQAMIIEVGQLHVMIEKCRHVSVLKKSYIIPSNRPSETQMLPNKSMINSRPYTGSLMKENDEIVYYYSEDFSKKAKKTSISIRMPDAGERKPFSSLQLLLQTQTYSKHTLFRGIPASTLARVDSELYRKEPNQLFVQSELFTSCNQLISQHQPMTTFAERQHNTYPTFPSRFLQVPTRVEKQAGSLNFKFRHLFRSLDNICYEASKLKQMISTAKRDSDRQLKRIALRLLDISQSFAPHKILTGNTACKTEIKSTLVQTDKVSDVNNDFSSVGKVYEDVVYRYCPKEVVDRLVTTCSHPTMFVRCLAKRIFAREEISMLFSEDMKMNQMERIRWIENMISVYYPYGNISSTKKSCLQALSALADYENLLLKLEKENFSAYSSGEQNIPVKRIRLDDACSSTYEQQNEKKEPDYLLPQTLLRIRKQQQNAEGFAVKVAILLYNGDDDIQRPCKEKRDQAKLIWLKEKVQEFYPADTIRNVNYRWSQCLDALDTYANKMKIMSFDEYDSSDEFECN